MENLENQIKDMMHKAFYDLLEKRVADPPDYKWITRLYQEIRDRLCNILVMLGRKDRYTYNEIQESMDVELFEQMIRHNAFSYEDFYKLIEYVFYKCKQLGSVARDVETDEKLNEIKEFISSGNATFATIVPMFIKNANHCIDNIYSDMKKLKETLVPTSQ